MDFRFSDIKISVNVPHAASLLSTVRARLQDRVGFALATINLDHLVKLHSDPDFLRAYSKHDLVTADGNPIVWLSYLANRTVQLVPGSDMLVPLARVAASVGAPVALVGTTAAALQASSDKLLEEVPALDIALRIAPPMNFDPSGPEARAILEQIRDAGIGICFIALGAPKQEKLAALGRTIAPNCGFASIGASLDFLAGSQTRAPEWIRQIAMEWVWRMMSNPRRLIPRYWACLKLLPFEAFRALVERH